MSAALSPTRSVLVIGAGIVGRAAVIALRRALPHAAVTLVELPRDADGWIDRIGAAPPLVHAFHRQIGLDPRLFVQRADAMSVRLRRYVRAGRPAVREACTAAIPFVEGVPLHQIWLRHRAEPIEAAPDFAAMLLALRDAHGEDGGFGMRFDAAAYAGLLGEMAARLGIVTHASAHIDVAAAEKGIVGVTLENGRTLTADLYVDAAGPRSRLLSALGAGWHDWSSRLPAMALSVAAGRRADNGEELLAAAGDGIRWQTPTWSADMAPSPKAPAPGRVAESWKANAVAIGEAAVRAPAVDGALLGQAFEDILRVIALIPRPGGGGSDIDEYVRRAAIAHDALADWSSLCLATDGAARSDALAETLAVFDARGRIALRELDPTPPGHWLARLMALRPAPRRIDPTALALPDTIVRSTIARAAPNGDRVLPPERVS